MIDNTYDQPKSARNQNSALLHPKPITIISLNWYGKIRYKCTTHTFKKEDKDLEWTNKKIRKAGVLFRMWNKNKMELLTMP